MYLEGSHGVFSSSGCLSITLGFFFIFRELLIMQYNYVLMFDDEKIIIISYF